MADPNGVTYPLKELLDRLERKLDSIDGKLDLKADRDRVHDVMARLSALELTHAGLIPVLKQFQESRQDIEDLKLWRNRVIGASGLAVVLGAAALAQALGLG